jgi:hypothetical protein
MHKFLIVSAAALCCAAALPAAAAPANAANADQASDQSARSRPTQQERARDPNRRICVNQLLSNSRVPRRICRTQAEWDAERAADND